ncbi:MAG: DEAD/DEAH box helicase [Deltaproteobacteria bacterium]|nr:DEAD/DEAH box helicase [Deltaproteobacteria bacterium]
MMYRDFELDAFQEQAIQALGAGHSVLVSAPTGTGKTVVADWIVDQALAAGRRVIYTAPIKALSNQKFRDYTALHGTDRVGLVTGDLVIRRDAPCLVMTTEILRNILLSGEKVDDLAAVVLDEIHFLDDRERGTTWEEVLIYLPSHVVIVGLSATLANLEEFASWLTHVRGHPVEVVVETKRAVPLSFQMFSEKTGLVSLDVYDARFRKEMRNAPPPIQRRGNFKQRGRSSDRGRRTSHLDVYRALEEQGYLPYLYFVFSRRDTEVHARALARYLTGPLLSPEESARLKVRLDRAAIDIGPALDTDVRALYEKGVAFHHAGLHVSLKAIVEELYEAKLVKVLYCTSTFALGINMPARSVAFDGVKKFDGRTMSPLPTRGFMQKAGRAGRRGMDDVGHVVVRMDFPDYAELQPILAKYREGSYEPVRSSFNLSWNSVINLLRRHPPDRIREILDKSFLSWHLGKQAEMHRKSAEQGHKGAAKLAARAERAGSRCWDEFDRKVVWLQHIGYLDDDLNFNPGARVLQHLQISEIPMTELVLSGVLETVPPTRLFGVLCALTNELPRHAERNFRLRSEDRALAAQVAQVLGNLTVLEGNELAGTETTWDPDLVQLGRAWAEGVALQEILLMVRSETDISGDLITGFRRAKDLVGQLVDVYRAGGDDTRADTLRDLVRTVSRDEVEVVD